MYEDPCFSMPCFNAGKCHVENSKFRCECQPGFHGNYCEAGNFLEIKFLCAIKCVKYVFDPMNQDLRRCTSSPCPNGCECSEIPFNMTFKCDCKKESKVHEFQQYETRKPTNGRRTCSTS